MKLHIFGKRCSIQKILEEYPVQKKTIFLLLVGLTILSGWMIFLTHNQQGNLYNNRYTQQNFREKRSVISDITAIINLGIITKSDTVNTTNNIVSGPEGEWVVIECNITVPMMNLTDKSLRWIFPGGSTLHKTTEIEWANITDGPHLRIHLERNITLVQDGMVACAPESTWAEAHWGEGILIEIRDSEKCPQMTPLPLSGLVAQEIPGVLYNNVKYIHAPVLLDFNDWVLPNDLCSPKMIRIYNTFMRDKINSFWKRNARDLPDPSNRVRSKRSVEGWVGAISGLFGSGMSVWNRADIEALYDNTEKLRNTLQQNLLKPIINSQSALEDEELVTVYNMHTIGTIFSDIQNKINEIITLHNREVQENKIGKAIACVAYGDYLLSKLTDILRDIELERIFDFITDDQIRKWYGNTGIGVTMCRIRDLGKITQHTIPCNDPLQLYIPITISLPIIPTNEIYKRLIKVHSVGNLESHIHKEFKDPPHLMIHQNSGEWITPQMSCCTKQNEQYVCTCNALDTTDSTCGLQPELNTEASSKTCAVKLTKWHEEMTRIAYVGDGRFCIVASGSKFQYGNNQCQYQNPNFCVIVNKLLRINGHTIFPIPVFHNISYIKVKLRYEEEIKQSVPEFSVPIPPLTVDVHMLMERSTEHILQMKQNTQRAGNSVLELTKTTWWDSVYNVSQHPVLRLTFKMLLVFQTILIIFGLILLCSLRWDIWCWNSQEKMSLI
ncbi:uncharacterized protein RCH25_036259 [Pelodytes ibericus]